MNKESGTIQRRPEMGTMWRSTCAPISPAVRLANRLLALGVQPIGSVVAARHGGEIDRDVIELLLDHMSDSQVIRAHNRAQRLAKSEERKA